jgi:patatin-like phospholipase/acyl hydrolase
MLILSIDGGGVRGLIPAAFLAELEKDLNQSLYNTFDIFAGSSVGAFIALGLSGLHYNGEQLLGLFNEKNVKQIFDKRFFSFLSAFYGPKYTGKGKRQLLQQVFADKRLFSLEKPTLITSYDIISNCAVVFKSHDTASKDSAYNPTLAEIADASSAAPTYFPTVETSAQPSRWLIDGGVSANDPTMCAIIEALHLGYKPEEIKVLSIGTGVRDRMAATPQCYGKKSQTWGGLSWLKHGLIDNLFSGNASIIEYQAAELLKVNYLRINDTLAPANDDLDDIKAGNLQALTLKGQQWYENNKETLLAWLAS